MYECLGNALEALAAPNKANARGALLSNAFTAALSRLCLPRAAFQVALITDNRLLINDH